MLKNNFQPEKNKPLFVVHSVKHIRMIVSKFKGKIKSCKFICTSSDAYLEGIKQGLNIKSIYSYKKMREHSFVVPGYNLAQEWLKVVCHPNLNLKKDETLAILYFISVFFELALTACSAISIIVENEKPQEVILYSDCPRPIIDFWTIKEGFGEIFAQVCAYYLNQKKIKNKIYYLSLKERNDQLIESFFKKNKIKLIYLYKIIEAYLLLIIIRLKKLLYKNPLIMMFGSGADSIYQGQLEDIWKKNRKWDILRFEAIDRRNRFPFRDRTLGSRKIILGKDLFLLKIIGEIKSKTDSTVDYNLLLQRQFQWVNKKYPQLCAVFNKSLLYQYKAMINFIFRIKELINLYQKAFAKLKPDLILTHNGLTIAPIAGRRNNIPSVTPVEGIGLSEFPCWPSLGDIICVNGELSKKNIELYNDWKGKIIDTGCTYIDKERYQINLKTKLKFKKEIKLVFLAPTKSLYPWNIEDTKSLLKFYEKIFGLTKLGNYRLIVKVHPRYGQTSFYKKLISFYGHYPKVKIDSKPNLPEVLKEADIILFIESSGAVIEALFAEKPLLWLSYLFPRDKHNALVCDCYRKYLIQIQSLKELLRKIKKLHTDDLFNKKILLKQNKFGKLCVSTWGNQAAENMARIIESQIISRISTRNEKNKAKYN